MYVDSIRFTNT